MEVLAKKIVSQWVKHWLKNRRRSGMFMAYWNALLRYVRFVWLSLLAPLFQQFGNQFCLLLRLCT